MNWKDWVITDEFNDYGGMAIRPSEINYRLHRIEQLNNVPAAVLLREQLYKFKPYFDDMPLKNGYDYNSLVINPCILSKSGEFQPSEYYIAIDTMTGKRRGNVLLHEMTHLHLWYLSQDINKMDLAEQLHSKLEKKFPNMDEAYNRISDVLSLYKQPIPSLVDHDYLFYLKSLDLDIRRRYTPGTVFGYAMKEVIDFVNGVQASSHGAPWLEEMEATQ